MTYVSNPKLLLRIEELERRVCQLEGGDKIEPISGSDYERGYKAWLEGKGPYLKGDVKRG